MERTESLVENEGKKRKRAEANAWEADEPVERPLDPVVDPAPHPSPDQGHRHGNFHNYYTFHPVQNRTQLLGGMMDYMTSHWLSKSGTASGVDRTRLFRYSDVGCNEGDLTIHVAEMLSERLLKQSSGRTNQTPVDTRTEPQAATRADDPVETIVPTPVTVQVSGFDMDPILIQRAQQKRSTTLSSMVQFNFCQLDVLQDGIPTHSVAVLPGEDSDAASHPMAALTTLFSTTMWIHIHGGDDGLRRVLLQICASTRFFIVLEAQPSKCYGTAATRLRRLGREPIDVSIDRLQLRVHIEEAVEAILKEGGFERVEATALLEQKNFNTSDHTAEEESSGKAALRTTWNRSLQLYQRTEAL